MDRPARAPLQVVLQLLRDTRVARNTRTILMGRDMSRVAVDLLMDRTIAIIVLTAREIGVGPEGYLFHVGFRNSNGEGLYPLRCGYSKWNTISPLLAYRNESM